MDDAPVIDFDTTPAEVREQLAHLNATAKRQMRVVGSPLLPTPWDRLHARMNIALDELEALGGL